MNNELQQSINEWTPELLARYCYLDQSAQRVGQRQIINFLNAKYPLSDYLAQRAKWQQAKANLTAGQELLERAKLAYPAVLPPLADFDLAPLDKTAIVLTAGGEGDRLRQSLLAAGYQADKLENFTKATWSLDDEDPAASTLGYNIKLCQTIGRALGKKIPVVVTLGPAGSSTADIIPAYLRQFDQTDVDIMTVCQGERLHLSISGQLVIMGEPELHAATNPDETGGAFMALTQPHDRDSQSLLHYLARLGIENILALQGTTICHPLLFSALAKALQKYDVAAVGVRRDDFPATDPFGSFVSFFDGQRQGTTIVEPHCRPLGLRELKDNSFGYLPANPGMYAFKLPLLEGAELPDFICPPKTICQELPPSGKVGYAAIDLLGLSARVAICLAAPTTYAALKGIKDIPALKEHAQELMDFLPSIK